MPFKRDDLPNRSQLIVATVMAIEQLGGSASIEEIVQKVVEILGLPEEAWDVVYPKRPMVSVLGHLLGFARWYPKEEDLLDKMDSGLYVLTPKGRTFLSMSDTEQETAAGELIRVVNARKKQRPPETASEDSMPDIPEDNVEVAQETGNRCEALLRRLHEVLDDKQFEQFSAYLLRLNGVEFERVGGGPTDRGVDALGIAWLSPVIATSVALQAKRHDPASTLPRDKISQFQGDCTSHHAEHGILATLGRVSIPAVRQARHGRPFITLLHGTKLCELIYAHRAELELWLRDVTGTTDLKFCDGETD